MPQYLVEARSERVSGFHYLTIRQERPLFTAQQVIHDDLVREINLRRSYEILSRQKPNASCYVMLNVI